MNTIMLLNMNTIILRFYTVAARALYYFRAYVMIQVYVLVLVLQALLVVFHFLTACTRTYSIIPYVVHVDTRFRGHARNKHGSGALHHGAAAGPLAQTLGDCAGEEPHTAHSTPPEQGSRALAARHGPVEGQKIDDVPHDVLGKPREPRRLDVLKHHVDASLERLRKLGVNRAVRLPQEVLDAVWWRTMQNVYINVWGV